MSEDVLGNVRDWYLGHRTPQVWGRYVSGHWALQPGELDFARRHGIYVYLLVPDSNCSVCDGGGDICGNDRTAAQAEQDARDAIQAALAEHIPAGAMLFKDVEQVGSCTGELTAAFLLAWFHALDGSPYRAGFYGNAYRQGYDFVLAYCAAIVHDPDFATHATLADDEPEPAISAPSQTIGPSTAPPFSPDVPACAAPGITRIWQYGESTTSANATDADEVLPGTAGLLAPDGIVTS
jgi:hypothetical protein